MKILHIIPSLKKGGAERLVIDICRELQMQKHETKILLLHEENDYRFLTESMDVSVTASRYRYHVLGEAEADFSDYRRQVEQFKPDVIHSHLFEADFFSRACLLPNVRYFSHLHDNMAQFQSFSIKTLLNKQRLTAWMEKHRLLRAYRECTNHFIANSEDTARFFRNHLPQQLSKRVAVLPNAIDLNRFPFVSREMPTSEVHLVTAGSLVPKKNHAFLFGVVSRLKTMGLHPKLTILGDGPLMTSLKQKVGEDHLQEDIRFAGNVDDVASRLAAAHVYVHPATYEPFGLAIVEAMASGLPVVCLDGGGNRPLIDDGKNGFILDEADAAGFAEKIALVISQPERYRNFAAAAGTKALQYSIKEYARKLISLYEQTFSGQ